MKKIMIIALTVVLMAGAFQTTVLGANTSFSYDEIEEMLYLSIDWQLIMPFSNTSFEFYGINGPIPYGQTYNDDVSQIEWEGATFGHAYLYGLTGEDEMDELMEEYDMFCPVICEKRVLDEALQFVLGVNIDTVLEISRKSEYPFCKEIKYDGVDCIIAASAGRGEIYPGCSVDLKSLEYLSNDIVYCKYSIYTDDDLSEPPSSDIYAILEKKNVCGQDLIGYRYLSLTPPTDEVLNPYRSQTGSDVTVTINGVPVEFDQPPIIQNGRTLVPVRAVFEAMGCDVQYYPGHEGFYDAYVIISDISRWINISIGSTEVKVSSCDPNDNLDNTTWNSDVPAQIINGRTVVPVRVLSEALGYNVQWDGNTRTVNIILPEDDAPFDHGSWKMLCTLVNYADDQMFSIDDNTEIGDIIKHYLTYPTVRDYLFDLKSDSIEYFNSGSDPLDRLGFKYPDGIVGYYYVAIDGDAFDAALSELFGTSEAEIEYIHKTEYYFDGKYYFNNEDIGGPYCDVYGYDVLRRNAGGSYTVRVKINEYTDGCIGYRECVVVPNDNDAVYPFKILSIGEFVKTADTQQSW